MVKILEIPQNVLIFKKKNKSSKKENHLLFDNKILEITLKVHIQGDAICTTFIDHIDDHPSNKNKTIYSRILLSLSLVHVVGIFF